jgi:glucokinase
MSLLTIDIGGSKCAVGLITDGQLAIERTWQTISQEHTASLLGDVVQELRESGVHLEAAGVCFGGPVDARTGRAQRSVHVPGWEDFDWPLWGTQVLSLPLAVDNDANVGALAESVCGTYRGDPLMYVTVSTGIGCGVIINGEVLHGAHAGAGELGHIRVSDDPRICSCGRTGCFERLCSGYWLGQDNGRPAQELLLDEEFLRAYCKMFARGLATAVLLYDPAVIVLGGGVSLTGQRLADAVSDALSQELGSWRYLAPTVAVSDLGAHGVHWGAGELARGLL